MLKFGERILNTAGLKIGDKLFCYRANETPVSYAQLFKIGCLDKHSVAKIIDSQLISIGDYNYPITDFAYAEEIKRDHQHPLTKIFK